MAIAELDCVTISYLDETGSNIISAKKIPIMLIHGFASNRMANWVNTGWVSLIVEQGYRVIAFDNRGHGESQKFYKTDEYSIDKMAGDAVKLLKYLNIEKVHLIGYSMGARISAMIALHHSERVGKMVLGGNGYGMIEGVDGWEAVAAGLLANSPDEIEDEKPRSFRMFADQTGSDRRALAACVLGTRQLFTAQDFARISVPTLIAIGGKDDIAGSGEDLQKLMPVARYLEIPRRDHMRAVGDKVFKNGVVEFLQ